MRVLQHYTEMVRVAGVTPAIPEDTGFGMFEQFSVSDDKRVPLASLIGNLLSFLADLLSIL